MYRLGPIRSLRRLRQKKGSEEAPRNTDALQNEVVRDLPYFRAYRPASTLVTTRLSSWGGVHRTTSCCERSSYTSAAAPHHRETATQPREAGPPPPLRLGRRAHQNMNAGMDIFIGSTSSPQPATPWCKIAALRRALLEKTRENLPNKPAAFMPPVNLSEQQFRAANSGILHAAHIQMAVLTHTPLTRIKASSAADYLTTWAILDTWTCTRVWLTPDHAQWPKACCLVN